MESAIMHFLNFEVEANLTKLLAALLGAHYLGPSGSADNPAFCP
jgi:hypothetical protein